jgi:hypothetical protein
MQTFVVPDWETFEQLSADLHEVDNGNLSPVVFFMRWEVFPDDFQLVRIAQLEVR